MIGRIKPTDLEERDFLSGIEVQLKECRDNFGIFAARRRTQGVLCRCSDISKEQKFLDREIDNTKEYLRQARLSICRLKLFYLEKTIMASCDNITMDGIIEINGYRYQLVEVDEK